MAKDWSIRLKGVGNLNKKLAAFEKNTKRKNYAGMERAMQFTKGKVMFYIPVDTGELKASSYVSGNNNFSMPVLEMGVQASLGAQGKKKGQYGVPVHEVTTNKHTPPTKAKYIKDTIIENSRKILQITTARVKV